MIGKLPLRNSAAGSPEIRREARPQSVSVDRFGGLDPNGATSGRLAVIEASRGGFRRNNCTFKNVFDQRSICNFQNTNLALFIWISKLPPHNNDLDVNIIGYQSNVSLPVMWWQHRFYEKKLTEFKNQRRGCVILLEIITFKKYNFGLFIEHISPLLIYYIISGNYLFSQSSWGMCNLRI
jgi:hypothetical protein